MRTIIVCTSVSHGNTKRIADVLAEVLSAEVVAPEDITPADLANYDLVGFGSGIFLQSFHENLRAFADSLPANPSGQAFVFATSGLPEAPFRPFTRPLVRTLEAKGFAVLDTFTCRAYDTWWPFRPFGGIRKGRPNDGDFASARAFAESLRARADSGAS